MPIDREELDRLFSEAYEELRRLAARVRGDDPAHTLNPTALVNEAYLKLAASLPIEAQSRLHLQRIAARAMRQVLVEAARRRRTEKRGANAALVTLEDSHGVTTVSPDELLTLDSALEQFATLNPRQAQVVELHVFGGLSLSDTARTLELSEATIDRDWRAARAWLARELRRAG